MADDEATSCPITVSSRRPRQAVGSASRVQITEGTYLEGCKALQNKHTV